MPQFTLRSKDRVLVFEGRLLAQASSFDPVHNDVHKDHAFVSGLPGRVKCRACRWNEVFLYRDTGTGQYVYHSIGRSICPGETEYGRLSTTPSALELVELMTVRANPPFLPLPAARVLAVASQDDDDIFEAYTNRAVS